MSANPNDQQISRVFRYRVAKPFGIVPDKLQMGIVPDKLRAAGVDTERVVSVGTPIAPGVGPPTARLAARKTVMLSVIAAGMPEKGDSSAPVANLAHRLPFVYHGQKELLFAASRAAWRRSAAAVFRSASAVIWLCTLLSAHLHSSKICHGTRSVCKTWRRLA